MFVRACLRARTRTILPIRHFSLSIPRASGHNKVSECVPPSTNRLLNQSTVEQNQDGRVLLTCISRLREVLTALLQAKEFLTKPVVWHTASTLECVVLFRISHHSAELLCRKSNLPFAVSDFHHTCAVRLSETSLSQWVAEISTSTPTPSLRMHLNVQNPAVCQRRILRTLSNVCVESRARSLGQHD